ncbi:MULTISPECIES: sigma-70 family RNA polymerase sigma factor [unclassified Streptomyces]|uniref:sigma-70 family RNA polymerase sigma factor n=1 Tax=unclassified Streptomyces TaxID=2593676 RepID=UPI002E32A2C2|nr:sigma-70 family RNA polymerase sigma factor [Streptomyces sp. NBC_01460]WSS28571.1 sigma-70 family RNA polymerase sigma factor [Streptomyces sp. NBC_01185]
MDEREWLGKRFEENRGHLRAVAYRMLGSTAEAEDAVQEAWLRLSRTDAGRVTNLGGWLTTVVGRVCLDMLRSRVSRRENPLGLVPGDEVMAGGAGGQEGDPEQQAVLADSVGLALLVVLETLDPAERLAFVLHDTFGVPFDEIAPLVERTPAAARQLASRARRRVRGAHPASDSDLTRRREVVDAFLTAARGGDFDALIAVLAPDVIARTDARGVDVTPLVRGAQAVASGAVVFGRIALSAQPVLVDGLPGVLAAQNEHDRRVMTFRIEQDLITEIEIITDPDRIRLLDLVVPHA